MSKAKLGDLLVESNLIDEVQMRVALEEQKRRGSKFGSTLLALGFVDENVLTAFLSKQLDMPCVSLNNIDISPKVRGRLTREQAIHYHAVPVRVAENRLFVALMDPLDVDVIEAIERDTGLAVTPMVAPESSISEALVRLYPDPAKSPVAETPEEGVFPDLTREIEEDDIPRQLKPLAQRVAKLQESVDGLHARMERIETALLTLLSRLGTPRE